MGSIRILKPYGITGCVTQAKSKKKNGQRIGDTTSPDGVGYTKMKFITARMAILELGLQSLDSGRG